MSFALSYDQLNENERRTFRSFGIFAFGPLNLAGLVAVNSAEKEEEESLLDHLVVVSMLSWGNGTGEYRIHPLLHKYSEFLFNRSDAEEQNSARSRFYHYYTSMANFPLPHRCGSR